MSSHAELPLLSLLSLATQQQRGRLVAGLVERGFDDIALPGARILAAIEGRSLSIQALAEMTGTTKQFTAREVRKLAHARYVTLQSSGEDRRVSLVQLQARGKKLLETSRKAKFNLDAAVEHALGTADARALRRILLRLLDA